jgi:hypothetical protein
MIHRGDRLQQAEGLEGRGRLDGVVHQKPNLFEKAERRNRKSEISVAATRLCVQLHKTLKDQIERFGRLNLVAVLGGNLQDRGALGEEPIDDEKGLRASPVSAQELAKGRSARMAGDPNEIRLALLIRV